MTSAERAKTWDRNEGALVSGLIAGLIICFAFAFVRPIGLSGTGLLILVLLIINSLAMTVRFIPESRIGERATAALLATGAVAAALLLMVDLTGFAFAFGGMAAGHAGFRLRNRWALGFGAADSALFIAALLLAPRFNNGESWPWYFGLLAGLPVLVGLYNRSRRQSLRNERVAAQQALRAAESEARASALNERTRIARDIHDVLAHSLSGVTMQLDLADALLEAGSTDRAHDAVRHAQRMTREGLIEARRAVQALREDALPLSEALAALTTDDADFRCSGDPEPLNTSVSQMFLRAAQESVTNARKHAPGAGIDVELSYLADRTTLTVTNARSVADRPLTDAGSGLGLAGMRERAALVDGKVTAGPWGADSVAPDHGADSPWAGGWQVRVEVAR